MIALDRSGIAGNNDHTRNIHRLPPATRGRLGLLVAALMLGCGPLPTANAGMPDPRVSEETPAFDPIREAQTALDLLSTGDVAALHTRFNAEMAAAVSAEQMDQGWRSLEPAVGPLQRRGEPTLQARGEEVRVRIPLVFQHGQLDAHVVFDAGHRIAGFALLPQKAESSSAPPPPADAPYTETELTVGEGAWALPATLSMPKGTGPFPAIVLVHGSGPHDRDETIGPNRPFLDIAHGLAARGIAVLRYEKRTRAHARAFTESGATIDHETTDDAVLATGLLRRQPGIDARRVHVLGHSLGGMLAPRIAQRDPSIAGLVLLAAPARPLMDILIEQHRRLAILNDGQTSETEQQAIQRVVDAVSAVRAGREPTESQSLMGRHADYWRSVEAVDQVADALRITQPMLMLQGARDIQVVDADWQRWRQALHDTPRVTFKLYESLNHIAIPGEGDGTIEEYFRPGKVSSELIDDIAAWIAAQSGTPAP